MPSPVVFALGKPAHRTPVIDTVVRRIANLVGVRVIVPKPDPTPGRWSVDGRSRAVRADVADAALIVQRGLEPEVLGQLYDHAARCVPDPIATAATTDRAVMARTLASSGVPVPRIDLIADYDEALAASGGDGRQQPNRDVIKAVDGRTGRGSTVLLPGEAPAEAPFDGPYLVQRYLPGWEAKLYVVGDHVRGARRGQQETTGGEVFDVDDEHADLSRTVARSTGLELCGVDVIVSARGPAVIDVNPFPSAAKIPGAADLISEHLIGQYLN